MKSHELLARGRTARSSLPAQQQPSDAEMGCQFFIPHLSKQAGVGLGQRIELLDLSIAFIHSSF